jgi:hypothetical protein
LVLISNFIPVGHSFVVKDDCRVTEESEKGYDACQKVKNSTNRLFLIQKLPTVAIRGFWQACSCCRQTARKGIGKWKARKPGKESLK